MQKTYLTRLFPFIQNIVFITFIIISFAFFNSCANKISVIPLSDTAKINKCGIVYALPRTSITIHFNIKHTTIKSGPFADYSQKYLGIENIQTQNIQNNIIQNISIESCSKPNPKECYFMKTKKNTACLNNNTIIKTKQGWMLNFPEASPVCKKETGRFYQSADTSLHHNPIFLSDKLYLTTDTLYKTLLKDSVFVRIPIYRKKWVEKDREAQAKEIADFLKKLRQRRIELITDFDDGNTNPQTFKLALNEIKHIEKKYLNLFTGEKIKYINTYDYEIVPSVSNKPDTTLLFNFSDEHGIISKEKNKGIPVWVIIIPGQRNNKNLNIKGNKKKNILYTRYPLKSKVMVKYGEQILFEQNLFIHQFGHLVPVYCPVVCK